MKYHWTALRGIAALWLLLLVGASLGVHLGLFGSPEVVEAQNIFASPGLDHWFGTDALGRDFLSRIFLGSGMSLMIATLSVLVSTLIGLSYGGIAGWLNPRLDWMMMIVLDVWMSLPSGVLAAILALVFWNYSDAMWVIGAVIGITHWGRLARLVRGEVLSLKGKEFVVATKLMGGGGVQIFVSHLLPHLLPSVGIAIIYQIPQLILAESFLSFIGLGIKAPNTSWGILLQDGWRSLEVYPHVVLLPALFLFLTILSLKTLVMNQNQV